MGFFSKLFGKKKKDKSKPSSVVKSATKSEAEIQVESVPTPAVEESQEIFSAEATAIATDRASRRVKVNGFGGAFDIKKSKDGRFVFNLYAANRVIVATSQIYSSSQAAITGIKSVIANAERASIEDKTLKSFTPQPFPKWEIYIDRGGQFRWRLLATNGNCILHSQGYTQKSTCKKGIESVIRTAKSAQIDKSYLDKE
ncbi:MAG: YegP family protein [Clostridia bacterium]|nr:YegP family protein [Clostridia bacterium]